MSLKLVRLELLGVRAYFSQINILRKTMLSAIFESKFDHNNLNESTETDLMEVLVEDGVSEHFGFVFGQDAVVDVGARTQVVVDTGCDSLNTQLNGFLSAHVVLVLRFQDGRGVQRSRAHGRVWKVGVTKWSRRYFPSALSMTR